jgi:hypothetical protein
MLTRSVTSDDRQLLRVNGRGEEPSATSQPKLARVGLIHVKVLG